MHTSLLDEDILKNIAGIDADVNEDEDMNQIQVIHHSSYYDMENLKATLKNNTKTNLVYLAQKYKALM